MNGWERERSGLLIFIVVVLLLACFGETSDAIDGYQAGQIQKVQIREKTVQGAAADKLLGQLSGKSQGSEYIDTPFGPVKRQGAATGPTEIGVTKDESKSDGPEVITNTVTDQGNLGQEKEEPVRSGIKSEKTEPSKAEKDGDITLNFDDADLYEVIRTFSEILKFSYIVDPNIRGRVTMQTTGSLSKKDIFPVFYQILEVNGLTAVKEGSLYRIIKMKESTRLPLLVRDGEDKTDLSPDQRVIMQVVPLKFISAQEMTKILTPFISVDGTILAHDGSNLLILVDKGINILKCLKLVEVFDADLFERVSYRFYFLNNTRAEDLAKVLKEVLSSYSIGKKEDVNIIPIERLNALLVISSQDRVLEEIESFLRELDIPSEVSEPQIYVYFVRNGEAKQLGDLLQDIFTKDSKKKEETLPSKTRTPTNPLSMTAVKEEPEKPAAAPSAPAPPAAGGSETGSGAIRGEVGITVDEVRNALIIKALPRDYQIIENVLVRIDIMPRQVLIEATIAEITLDETTDLGIEWTFDNINPVAPFRGGLTAGIGAATGGLQYTVQLTDRWKAALHALATDKKVNVLSSPHVLASDNKEARIDVSDEIPVATTSYETTSSTTTPVFETSIQYRDTGIILTVTPHINDNGMVTMDISQEVSDPLGNYKVGGKDYPGFTKRSVNTTLTVKHGQTLVIGGLIKETKSDSAGGVPCLIKVPVLRFLSGSETKEIHKKELIIMITPRVVQNLEDVDAVTEEFKKKVKSVKLQFEEYKEKRDKK